MRRMIVTALIDMSGDPSPDDMVPAVHAALGYVNVQGGGAICHPLASLVLHVAEIAAPGSPPRPEPDASKRRVN